VVGLEKVAAPGIGTGAAQAFRGLCGWWGFGMLSGHEG
jgi:hypothetical protein